MLKLRETVYTSPKETELSSVGEEFKKLQPELFEKIARLREDEYRDPDSVRGLLEQLGLSIRRHGAKSRQYVISSGNGISHIGVIEDILMSENRYDVVSWGVYQISHDAVILMPVIFGVTRGSNEFTSGAGFICDSVSLCSVLYDLY